MLLLKIPESISNTLLDTARQQAPLEACGLLAGKDGEIKRFYQMTNVDKSSEHFSMVLEEQFSVIRDVRQRGLDLMAIWHSHPFTPARMSAEDIRLAYTPGVVYLITSLVVPEKNAHHGFIIEDNSPKEIPILILKGKTEENNE